MRKGRHTMRPWHVPPWARRLPQRPAFAAGAALLGVALIAGPLAVSALTRSRHQPTPATWLTSLSSPARKTAEPASPNATPAAPAAAAATQPVRKATTPGSGHRTQLIAFYANFDDFGYPSLEAHIDEIDVLMPMWYHLDSSGRVTVDDPAKQARVMRLIEQRNPGLKVMPIVNNYDKAAEKWNAPEVAKLLADPSKRRAMATAVVTAMTRDGFDGVNVDFESFTAADRANIVAFMSELYPRAKKAGLEVSMDVIVAGAAYDHAALSRHVDYLIPMMYDEHWKTSPSGPISSQGWFERTLAGFYAKVPAEKVVVGLGTYSYDWGKPGQRAASKTYRDAAALARAYDKPMNVHSTALNSTFAYQEAGVTHRVWMLDSVSAFNQMSSARADAPRGYAIWRLGAEDPALWDVVPRRDSLDASVAKSLESGSRTVVFDEASGLITGGQTRP